MNFSVSVVVPTYRRSELLRGCLTQLARQSLDARHYEIVVADDAGDAATRTLVEKFASASRVSIRYVPVGPAHGPAAARNAGWRAAAGEIIAFTDDDCLPAESWLERGLSALRSATAAAATGRVIVPLPARPTDYERDVAGLSRAEFVTANVFCRREALEEAGGFDERFTAAWREDSDLQFTLLECGRSIVAAPEAVVVHPVRPAAWGVSLGQQRKTAFDALLFRKHPQLYRQHIAGIPPSYLVSAAAMAAAVAALLCGATAAAAASAIVWAAFTALFYCKRIAGASCAARHVAEMAVTSALIPPLSLYWRVHGMVQHRTLFLPQRERRAKFAAQFLTEMSDSA